MVVVKKENLQKGDYLGLHIYIGEPSRYDLVEVVKAENEIVTMINLSNNQEEFIIDTDEKWKCLRPILLTEEILEDNGFEKLNYNVEGQIPETVYKREGDNTLIVIDNDSSFKLVEESQSSSSMDRSDSMLFVHDAQRFFELILVHSYNLEIIPNIIWL